MSAGSWEDSSKIKDEKDEQEPVKKRPPPRPAGPPPRPSAPPPRPAPISIKPSSSRSTSPTPHPPPPASLSGAAVVGHTLTTANKKAHKIFSSLKTKAGLKSPKHFIKEKKNKSPLPSPSKEKFDSVAPEEKTNGSEEWFAFQRMLERTKETVIKTKENLSRLTSKDEPDYSPDSETESKAPTLKRKDALDSLDEETEVSKQGKDIPQLTVTSVPRSRPTSQDIDKDQSFELDTDSSLANGIDKISSAATGGSVQDLLGLGLDDFASPPEPESDDWLSSHKSQFEKDFLLAEEEKLSRSTKSVTDELVDSFLGLDTTIHRSPLVSPTVLSPVVSISASGVESDPFVIPKIPDPVDLSTIRKGIASGVKAEPGTDPFFVKSATSSPPDPFLGKGSDPFAVTPVEPSTDPFAVSSDPFAFKSKSTTESNTFALTADQSLDPFAVTPTKPDTTSLPFLTPDLISSTSDPFAASTSDPFTPVKSGLTTPTTDPFAVTSSGFASPTADLFPVSPGIPRTSADLFGPANELASSSTDPFSNTLGQATSTSGSFVAGLSAPVSDPFAISSPGAELFASATSDLFESKSGFATPSTDFFAASPAADFPAFPAAETSTSDQFTSSTSTDPFAAASDLSTKLFPTSISIDPTTSDPFAFAASPATVIATPEPYSTISEPLDFTSVSAGNPFLSAIVTEEDTDVSAASGLEFFSTISEPLETFSAFDFETETAGPLIPEKDPFSTTSEPIDVASDKFKKSEDLPTVSQVRSIIVPKVCITTSFETVSEPVDSNVDTSDTNLTPSSPVEIISSVTVKDSEPVAQDSTSDPFRSQSPFGFSDTGSFPPPPPPTEFTDATFDAAWSTLTPTDITLPPAVDASTADSTFSLTSTAFTESANIFTSANMSEPTTEPLFPVVPEADLLMDTNSVAESNGAQETKPAAVSEPDNATVLPPAIETVPILEPDPATEVAPELTDTLPQMETVPPADAPVSDPVNIFGMTDPIIPMAPLAPMIPLAPTPLPVSSSVTATGEGAAATDSTSVVADFSSLDTAFSAQDDFFSGTCAASTKGNDFFSSEALPATTNTGGDMFSLLDDSFPAAPTTAPAASDGSLQDTVDLFGTSDPASKADSSFPTFADSSFGMTNSAFSTLEPSVTSTPAIFAEPAFPAMDPVGALTTDPTDSVSAMEMSQNNPFEGMESDDVPVPISGNNPFSMFETIEDETSKEILEGQSAQTVPSIGTESVATNLDAFLQPSVVPPPVTATDNVATTEDTTTITPTATDTENVSFTDSGANPFMDKTEIPADPAPASVTEATEDFFDEDFFNTKTAEKKAQGAKINPKSAWGMMESVDKDSTFNPFQDDNFDADNIPRNVLTDTQNQEVPSEAKNPFLSSDFEAPVATTTETTVNPFLTQVDELEKAQSTLSDNLSLFLGKGQELDPSHLPLDVFDPFKTIEPDDIPEPTVTAPVIQTVDSSDDEKDSPDNEDNKDAFKLTIRMRDPVESGPSVALPPPPKVPKSPQMAPRINPFDKESPPEENFAKFEVMETKEKPKAQRTETQMSVSTDGSGTPDEEEENLEPLESFLPRFEDDGWSLMLRQPTKKKLTGNRYWKTIHLRLVQQNDGPVLKLYHSKEDKDSFQELPLQPCYSMSDIALQHYDQYGKIHTLKIQYVFYRERVGIRTEKITPTFVKNMKPKANMILDHSPQISELLKFGSLDEELVLSFVQEVEDALMRIVAHREKTLSYQKDEVIVDVIDEYKANIDIGGHIVSQKGRVRIFCLSFVTGMPFVELGVNDRRRKGREVVGRHDIIPIKTEEWIKPENIEFHCSAKPEEYEKDGTIKFHPLDACHFELMRFRVRLRYNKELPLQVRVMRDIKERHVEYRCDVVCTGYHAYSKKHGQFPCEDIEIRFPIPDCWIYLFRYEKRFGYGSFKSATRKPGKIKGLERLTMMTQSGTSPALLEASVGTAKYENIYHAIVWRISRLPERNQGAYKTHLFTLRLDLGLHDEIPETYEMFSNVKFTMPASTISKCQIRSISCGNPTPPEKWVRYIAHYEYKVAIDHKFETNQIKKVAEIDKMIEAEGETSTTAEEEASSPGTSPES